MTLTARVTAVAVAVIVVREGKAVMLIIATVEIQGIVVITGICGRCEALVAAATKTTGKSEELDIAAMGSFGVVP
jgi:hypothetical protein